VQVVEHLLGIKINDLIVIDFQAFAFLTDGLGCVYIDVDHLYSNPATTATRRSTSRPGTGRCANTRRFSYVRYRHDDSTYRAMLASRTTSVRPSSSSVFARAC